MAIKNKRIILLTLSALLLLSVPLITMQFSEDINWNLSDFLVAAVLLFGAIFSLEIVLKYFKKNPQRIILVAIVLILLILIWMELAVGIFGTPLAGN